MTLTSTLVYQSAFCFSRQNTMWHAWLSLLSALCRPQTVMVKVSKDNDHPKLQKKRLSEGNSLPFGMWTIAYVCQYLEHLGRVTRVTFWGGPHFASSETSGDWPHNTSGPNEMVIDLQIMVMDLQITGCFFYISAEPRMLIAVFYWKPFVLMNMMVLCWHVLVTHISYRSLIKNQVSPLPTIKQPWLVSWWWTNID